jgi:allantoate deiminase
MLEDAREVIRRCRTLATYSEEPGFTTRTFLSEPMRLVHAEVSGWMTRAGMDVRIDAAGNIRGLYSAAVTAGLSDRPRLFIGSHLDTVPRAGAFDGVLGVMMGIALVEALDGHRFPFSIEVIGFSEEEGVRFGVPFIGSRALVGSLDDTLLARVDRNGASVRDAIRQFGLDPAAIAAARPTEPALGYLEFHIEQGPVLDRLGLGLGIVTAIAGQTRADVTFTGVAGHAGAMPMAARLDALACAAEWISRVEREGKATPGLVATVGRVSAHPGATNVIAGQCTASLDVRHVDDDVRRGAVERLQDAAHDIPTRRGLDVTWQTRLEQSAVAMTPSLVTALTHAVERSGAPVLHMHSGAGHDAMIVVEEMPATMLFLRSPGGISHHPDESVSGQDVAAALAAGRQFLEELADLPAGLSAGSSADSSAVARSAKVEAQSAKAEAQSAKAEAQSAKAEARSAKADG